MTSNGFADVFLARTTPVLSGVRPGASTVTAFTMSRAYPNPTAGRSRFRLDVVETGHVRVGVYDVAGRLVSELHNGVLQAGVSRYLEFGGKNLPSGIYFVRVGHPTGVKTAKVMVLR